MILLVPFTIVLQSIVGGSSSSDEEYGNPVTASSNDFQSDQELAPSESSQCPICGLCFRNHGVHMMAHNQQKTFSCSQCDKQYTSANALRMHQQIHSGEKTYDCAKCGKQFIRADVLRRHQQTHTNVKSFLCDTCGKQFVQAHDLQVHQRKHTGEKPFICPDCGMQFAYGRRLRTHRRTHTGEKPFICSDCGNEFACSNNLRIHQRIHTGVKPFRCTECGKQFFRGDSLRKHQRSHNEKPLFCPICGKLFRTARNLQIHYRRHNITKTFDCSHCGKQFIDAANMRRHQRMHTGEKPFQCLQCGERFERVDYLKSHQRKKHAALEDSTGSPSIGYAENSTIEKSPSSFQSISENLMDSLSIIQLENPIIFNCSPLGQTVPENLDDNPSFVQIKNLAVMQNPPLLHSVLEIPTNAAASSVEIEVSAAGKDPFLLQSDVDNSVGSSCFIETSSPTELESPFLLHTKNIMYDPSLLENAMEGSFTAHLQNPTAYGSPFFFQNPTNKPSLEQKEEGAVLQSLIDIPSLVRSDTHSESKMAIDNALFALMQEHIPGNAEGSVPEIQLASGDSDAVTDNGYLECPVCFELFGGREALKDHLLNSSCSLFPVNWLSYLENGNN